MGAQADRELRGASSFCSELLASLPRPVLVLDTLGRVVLANDAAERFFDVQTPRPLTGLRYEVDRFFGQGSVMRSLDRVGQPAGPAPDLVASTLASGEPSIDTQVVVERPRGRLFLSIDALPLHSELRGVIGVGLVFSDETERFAQRSEGEWLRRDLLSARHRVEDVLRLSEALNAIGQMIHSTLDFDEILRRAIGDATRAIGAQSGVIELRERDTWVVNVVYGLSDELLGHRFSDDDAPWGPIVRESRAPLAVPDVLEDERFGGGPMERFRMRSLLAVPLHGRGEVIGVLAFHDDHPVDYSREQVEFASRVATTLSLAIENSRAYAEERHIADTLQQALLVVPDAIGGVDFAHLYRSATEAAWVGGDFFDIFELPGDCVGIVIGDISGKGVEASALASFARQLLKAEAQAHTSPAEVVTLTSDLVYRVSRSEDFVTLFFGVLCRADGLFTFCSAGHPSPILWSGGETSLLENGGPLAGAWEGLDFNEHTTHLGRGDLLVLYTDGLIEAKRDGELYGETRLVDLVGSLTPQPLGELAPALVAAVADFAHGRLRDDVALLLVSPTAQE